MATYTIKTGDTLSKIAAENNSTVGALAKLNKIENPDLIQAGASLNIPGAVPPPPTAPAPAGQQTAEQRAAAFKDAGVTPTPIQPSAGAISTTDLSRATELPDATSFAETQPAAILSDAVTAVAGQTLTSTGKAIDALEAQRQATITAEKDVAAEKVADVEGRIETLGEERATAAQDVLAETRDKFQVEQTIQSLKSVETKILAAQEALNVGLIYEMDRPARQQLLVGRSASLQKQGLATIGALQATGQILQGNIDLAESYAQTTIDAVLTDNQNAMNSLNTLLTLHNNKLVTLTADEKKTVDSRIQALKDQDKEVQKNKTDVFDLMANYPSAAVEGGVTLLDDRGTAIKKMLPKMSAMEMEKFNASIADAVSTEDDEDGPAVDKQQLLAFKANGMTYQEALNAYSDTLSVDWINDVYRKAPPKAITAEQQVEEAYYQTFLEPEGGIKPGTTLKLDEKGRVIPEAAKGETTWWKPSTWF